MRFRTLRLALSALVLLWLLPANGLGQLNAWQVAAMADDPIGQTILGQGSATVKRVPTILRMHIEVLGKGETLKEALDKLKARRQAAVAQLKTLKADHESIELGSPSLSNVESQRRRQLEAMVIQRYSARGGDLPKGLKVPKAFTVSVSLTAEWPLEADGPEQMLLATQALQEKVRAADLAGTKDAEALSPEEQELAEEMSDMMGFSGEQEAKPGEPHFLYVARISEEDRDKAFAEAFAKAKEQASRLAQAAGARLGPLVALSGQGGGGIEFGDDMYGYEYQSYLRRLIGTHGGMNEPGLKDEAVASDPGSLSFAFYVKATFRLEN